MNKKKLSVVMAGAMLATSVAPVLAAETTTQKDYEVNGSNKGLLIKELRNLIESKTFANVSDNGKYAGKSVYYVKKITHEEEVISLNTVGSDGDTYKTLNQKIQQLNEEKNMNLTYVNTVGGAGRVKLEANKDTVISNDPYYEVIVRVTAVDESASGTITIKAKELDTATSIETAIQEAKNGDVFKVYDRGHVEKDGKYYAFSKEAVAGKFEKADLKAEYNEWKANKKAYKAVYEMSLNETEDELTVKTRSVKEQTEDTRIVYKYAVGSDYVDFTKPVNSANEVLAPDFTDENGDSWVTSTDIVGFAIDEEHKVNAGNDIPEKHLYTITISDADKVYNVTLSELYDGLFLTDKGQELVDTLKLYDSKRKNDTNWKINDGDGASFRVNTEANGLYSLEITFEKPVPGTNNNVNKVKNKVIITSNNKSQMDLFANGLAKKESTEGASRKFPVQVLAGSNRYETAVKVAKENADITTVAENGNIVLVNGNSLVDGLAAAPLASSVINKDKSSNYAAPILLTDSNGIPKATKDYMKEVIAEQKVGKLGEVTVYLVGGEAVISKSVENDLKEIGFRVVRAGGADREATSLAVAKLMNDKEVASGINDENAFVVGANGEADAMSIAPVAAATGTPIIVESVHGISDNTIDYLKGYKLGGSKDVTIIGGETSVSTVTENTLKEEKIETARLAGENRKETNAKVIDAYYGVSGNTNGVSVNPGHQFENVVVSKDGMNNKSELIDALTATSLAVRDNAPIVLGTKSLSKSQINTLEKNASRNGIYVYQVGLGVARDVVKTIADRVGLAK